MSSKLYSAIDTDYMMDCMGIEVPMFRVIGPDREECEKRLKVLIARYKEIEKEKLIEEKS